MTSLTVGNSSVKFLPQGAIIQELVVEGYNIVLGFPTANPYSYLNSPFFGETIGRYANRVEDGLIKGLNGRDYQLAQNNDVNSLHGGSIGFGKRIFSGPHRGKRNGKDSVQFTYTSPDGEEGYPGTLELRVWYSVSEVLEDNVKKFILDIEYEAELVGQECGETAINITNHSYFNITTGPTIEGTVVVLDTDDYLPVDDKDIPLSHVEKFPGITAGSPFILGKEEPDTDHCFIMDTEPHNVPIDTRQQELRRHVALSHPRAGLHFEVYSTEPAFQFYTGKYINVPVSEHGPERSPRSGLCVEPGRFINAINQPEWRNQVILKQGEVYGAKIAYKAWKTST